MNFILLGLLAIFFSKQSLASFLDLPDDNIRYIAKINHSSKSLRVTNQKLALLFSNEFSPLELIFKNEKYEEILKNPSSYFPLKTKSPYIASSNCRFNKDHLEMLIKAQPNMHLLKICASELSFKDIEGISKLSNLRSLSVSCATIQNLSFLENNTKLIHLEIRGKGYYCSNTDALKKITKLKELSLLTLGIEDINGLSDMISLRELNLYSNRIKNLRPLSKLQNLYSLKLGYQNSLKDVSPLADLTNLQILDLNHTKIEDILSLRKLQNLKKLSLANSTIKTLAPLAYLQNLEILDLDNLWRLKSIEFKVLEKLTNLRKLCVDKTNINDYFFLWNMKNFEELTIEEGSGGKSLSEFEKANPSIKIHICKHDY